MNLAPGRRRWYIVAANAIKANAAHWAIAGRKATMTGQAQLYAEYTGSCFCERPPLAEGPLIPYRPRFEFAKAAKRYANELGMITFHVSPYKTAQGEVAIGCSHRATQWIRIDWRLV